MTESTKQHQRAKGLSRSEKMICLALFLMTFVGVPYYIHWHTDTIEWRRSHYAHIVVELEVDGEPVIFDRIIECKYMPAQGGGEWFARISNMRSWPSFPYPVARKLAHTMDDGTHVMLRTPRVCARKRVKKTREELDELRPLPAGWVPRVAIAENVTARDKVEVYIEPAAYTHPDSRVTYKGTRFSFLKNAKPSPLDKGAWFFSDYYEGIQGEFAKRGVHYKAKGYFIHPIPLDKVFEELDLVYPVQDKFIEFPDMSIRSIAARDCPFSSTDDLFLCLGKRYPFFPVHISNKEFYIQSQQKPYLIAYHVNSQFPMERNALFYYSGMPPVKASQINTTYFAELKRRNLILVRNVFFDASQ